MAVGCGVGADGNTTGVEVGCGVGVDGNTTGVEVGCGVAVRESTAGVAVGCGVGVGIPDSASDRTASILASTSASERPVAQPITVIRATADVAAMNLRHAEVISGSLNPAICTSEAV